MFPPPSPRQLLKALIICRTGIYLIKQRIRSVEELAIRFTEFRYRSGRISGKISTGIRGTGSSCRNTSAVYFGVLFGRKYGTGTGY